MPIAGARSFAYRSPRKTLWTSRADSFTEASLFILGVAGCFSVDLVGSIPACEILLYLFLPVLLLAQGRRAFNRKYAMFYVVSGAWLLGTVISDTYNGIGGYNWIKGMARVIFFALDFIALAILINGKTRRLVIFALSIAVVLFGSSWAYKANFNVQWKYGLGESVAIVALLISSSFYAKRRYGICFLILAVLAALSLFYGFRSQLAVLFVSAVLILPLSAKERDPRRDAHGDKNPFKIVILLVLAGGAAYAASSLIQYAAKRGFFDESTQSKFQSQAAGDYGVLFGGRPETLVAIQAIRDSPLIGHGSFAYGEKYVELKQDIMYEHGYSDTDDPEVLSYPTIPTHSHLTLAWVEGGIFGGICWIYILVLTARAVFRLTSLRPHLAPLYSYLLVGFIWDILYSPFGSINRILAAFYILLGYSLVGSPARKALPVSRKVVVYKHRLGVPGAVAAGRLRE